MKERAVRMVHEAINDNGGDRHGVITRIARQLGVGDQSLRSWVAQAEIDSGQRPGLTTEERAELVALRKENRELKRSNAILRSASAFFAAELDRPQPK